MRRIHALGALVLLAGFVTMAGAAEPPATPNVVRGIVFFSSPTGDDSSKGFKFEPDNGVGVSLAYERRFTDLIGGNFDLGYVEYDVKAKGNGLDGTLVTESVTPFTAVLLFHPFTSAKTFDWYVGPGVSLVDYSNGNIKSDFRTAFGRRRFEPSYDLTWAFQTGVDIYFGDTWGLNLDLKYISTSVEVKEFNSLDFKPVNLGVGFTARF